MKLKLLLAATLLAGPALASEPDPSPSPAEIVAGADARDWVPVPETNLLVMDLAPQANGGARRVIIQLISQPFSRPWVSNIRTLARAHWWDGLAIVRSQDNYVVQWGDPDGEDAAKARALPPGLQATREDCYSTVFVEPACDGPPASAEDAAAEADEVANSAAADAERAISGEARSHPDIASTRTSKAKDGWHQRDSYAPWVEFYNGWPVAAEKDGKDWRFWPVHCYGSVGVGRDISPSAGTGAELYTVIGQAPRHLDRNIAVVGRVIEGIEHLSTLPRGTEALGFYATPAERTPIASIRLASELPAAERPRFEYLSTDSASFARYVNARANRHDTFFIKPAGGVDICNAPVPVRRVAAAK